MVIRDEFLQKYVTQIKQLAISTLEQKNGNWVALRYSTGVACVLQFTKCE